MSDPITSQQRNGDVAEPEGVSDAAGPEASQAQTAAADVRGVTAAVHALPDAAKAEVAAAAMRALPEAAKAGVAAAAMQALPDAAKAGVATTAMHALPDAAKAGLVTAAVEALPDAAKAGVATTAMQGLPDAAKAGLVTTTMHALPDAARTDATAAAVRELPEDARGELIQRLAPDQEMSNDIWRWIVRTFAFVLGAATVALVAAVFVSAWRTVDTALIQMLLTIFTTTAGILAGFVSGRASTARSHRP